MTEREERQEEIAKKKRKFWTRDLLLEGLWKRVEFQKEVARWSQEILFKIISKVKMISSLTHEILERVEREVDKKYLVQENEVINLGGRTLKMKTKEDDWWRDKETPEELKEREENSKKKEKITRIATRRIQKTARIKEDNIGREKMSKTRK